MNDLTLLSIVDTNVPKIANLSNDPDKISDELVNCVNNCVDAIDHVIKTMGLVIDSGDEIFDEYRQQLEMSGRPGIGDRFMKWVHDNRWKLPEGNRVKITQTGSTYAECPDILKTINFDKSDEKFVAVANAHPLKPPILQATDSKWWGWKEDLASVDINVYFLCPNYVQQKYEEKMGS